MPTVSGELSEQDCLTSEFADAGALSRPLTFAEEAEWCRAEARAVSRKSGALMLLRIAGLHLTNRRPYLDDPLSA